MNCSKIKTLTTDKEVLINAVEASEEVEIDRVKDHIR